ncbi:Retinol dehydrogenase 16 [Coccomyxa sp. Obi]|nr:Retinol dehydrogenase 16 [Coccomyxa sp. Obi]
MELSPTKRRSVVVTGVSTGIGFETAKALIVEGFHVFGSVRKQSHAADLRLNLGAAFTPLLFDVTDEAAIAKAALKVRQALQGRTLFGLVNNAGVANHACLAHQPIEEFRRVIHINLIGTLAVTQAFLPQLGADATLEGPPGRIINMSSISGKYSAPFVGAYCASKHALEGMSDSLRRELMLFGIDVIVVGPGYVATPIWDRQEITSTVAQYKETEFAASLEAFDKRIIEDVQKGHAPGDIARVVVTALTAWWPKTRYAIVAQPFSNWILPMWLPARWMDSLMAASFLVRPDEAKKKNAEK